ncbi:MAG: hypothetical protein HYY00_03835 [Chloroflexi bacterium]|nr:hypothetical protein [Chloroflexota bacterium]
MRASITFEEHRERIVECCSLRDDYIMPNMPLLEAVFRIILAKNEPVGLQEVHRSLMERWASRDLPRSVSEETLHRILRRDAFYGIQEIVPERPSLAANG